MNIADETTAEPNGDYFARHAATLIDNQWVVVPIPAGRKGPRKTGWQQTTLASAKADLIGDAGRPSQGIGILTGEIVAVDIDVLDEQHSQRLAEIAQQHLGPTEFARVGRAPKQMLIYRRQNAAAKKLTLRLSNKQGLEFLAAGQQFVAFHIHPDTGKPYVWLNRSPLDATTADLPVATETQIASAFTAMRDYCVENGLLEDNSAKSQQGELVLTGVADSGMRGEAALSRTGNKQPTPKRQRQGGRVATGGWRLRLDEIMQPGATDQIGGVAASYAQMTPIHRLSEVEFSATAMNAAARRALNLTTGGRAHKIREKNSARNISSAVDRYIFDESLVSGTAPKRQSADEVFSDLQARLFTVMPAFAEFARQRDMAMASIVIPNAGITINTKQDWAGQQADTLAAQEAGLVVQSARDAKRAALTATHDQLPNAPLFYATPTMGVGKSGLSMDALAETLAQWGGRSKPRILFFTERHDLLAQLVERLRTAIDALNASEAAKLPKMKKSRQLQQIERRIRRLEWAKDNVFHVRSAASHACADDNRRELHKEFAAAPISRTKAICKQCPLAKTCEVYAVNSKASDEAGVYFLASSHLNHVGKYDGRLAHLVIIDEDPTATLRSNAKLSAFSATPLASFFSVPPVVAWDADEANEKNAMRIIPIDAWQVANRIAINLPHKTMQAVCSAVEAWLAAIAGEREALAVQVEAMLEEGRQKSAADMLTPLRDVVAREHFAEAVLATIRSDAQFRSDAATQNRRDPGPLVHAPIVWQVTKGGDAEIVTEYLRQGLRSLRTTPLIALNGTARLPELLGGLGALSRRSGEYSLRPAFSFDGHATPGAGVTHLTVPDTFIPKGMFVESADERSNNFAFESFAALIEALHGQTLVIAPKAHEDAVRGNLQLREVVDRLNRQWGRNTKPTPLGIDGAAINVEPSRLHFGAQRGNDEHGKAAAIVCIGQSLPRSEAIELSARARGLAAGHVVGGGGLAWQHTAIERSDGRFIQGISLRHPDIHCEAERSRVVTDECTQAVHRGRAVRRSDPHMVITIGTEYGRCGVPADKFARLTDVRHVSRCDIAAMTGVLPLTPMAFARSVFGQWFGAGMTASPDAVSRAAANIEKNGTIPSEQEVIDAGYAAEHLFGHWKPGQPLVAAPTWGVFECRPAGSIVVQCNTKNILKVANHRDGLHQLVEHTPMHLPKKEEEVQSIGSGHLHGGMQLAGQATSPPTTVWGQKGPANRWLVKLTGYNSHPDPKAAIEAVSGPVASIKQVATLTAKLSNASKHALTRCGLGVLPSSALAGRVGAVSALTTVAVVSGPAEPEGHGHDEADCQPLPNDDDWLQDELAKQHELTRHFFEYDPREDDDSSYTVMMPFPATQKLADGLHSYG